MNDVHPARAKYPPRAPDDPGMLQLYQEGQLKLFRLMFEMAPDAIVSTDPAGLVTEANPAALALLGRSKVDVEDHPIFDFLVDEFDQPLRETVGRMVQERRRVIDRHVFVTRPEGGRTSISLSCYPLVEQGEIVRVIGFLRDRTELERLVQVDEKTGLLNERTFHERLDEYVRLARRKNFSLGVGYFDLRKFKPLNDRFGHAEGDRVIKKVGALLRGNTYETDLRARLHGDEFAVLLVRLEPSQIPVIATKLAHALSFSIDLVDPKGGSLETVTVCADIGIAWRLGAGIPDGNAFLEIADRAMYACKRDGKSFVLDVDHI
jgi:diguanylate cyclase (GGDEF)-like protein/PAS domain S-box-containing protein